MSVGLGDSGTIDGVWSNDWSSFARRRVRIQKEPDGTAQIQSVKQNFLSVILHALFKNMGTGEVIDAVETVKSNEKIDPIFKPITTQSKTYQLVVRELRQILVQRQQEITKRFNNEDIKKQLQLFIKEVDILEPKERTIFFHTARSINEAFETLNATQVGSEASLQQYGDALDAYEAKVNTFLRQYEEAKGKLHQCLTNSYKSLTNASETQVEAFKTNNIALASKMAALRKANWEKKEQEKPPKKPIDTPKPKEDDPTKPQVDDAKDSKPDQVDPNEKIEEPIAPEKPKPPKVKHHIRADSLENMYEKTRDALAQLSNQLKDKTLQGHAYDMSIGYISGGDSPIAIGLLLFDKVIKANDEAPETYKIAQDAKDNILALLGQAEETWKGLNDQCDPDHAVAFESPHDFHAFQLVPLRNLINSYVPTKPNPENTPTVIKHYLKQMNEKDAMAPNSLTGALLAIPLKKYKELGDHWRTEVNNICINNPEEDLGKDIASYKVAQKFFEKFERCKINAVNWVNGTVSEEDQDLAKKFNLKLEPFRFDKAQKWPEISTSIQKRWIEAVKNGTKEAVKFLEEATSELDDYLTGEPKSLEEQIGLLDKNSPHYLKLRAMILEQKGEQLDRMINLFTQARADEQWKEASAATLKQLSKLREELQNPKFIEKRENPEKIIRQIDSKYETLLEALGDLHKIEINTTWRRYQAGRYEFMPANIDFNIDEWENKIEKCRFNGGFFKSHEAQLIEMQRLITYMQPSNYIPNVVMPKIESAKIAKEALNGAMAQPWHPQMVKACTEVLEAHKKQIGVYENEHLEWFGQHLAYVRLMKEIGSNPTSSGVVLNTLLLKFIPSLYYIEPINGEPAALDRDQRYLKDKMIGEWPIAYSKEISIDEIEGLNKRLSSSRVYITYPKAYAKILRVLSGDMKEQFDELLVQGGNIGLRYNENISVDLPWELAPLDKIRKVTKRGTSEEIAAAIDKLDYNNIEELNGALNEASDRLSIKALVRKTEKEYGTARQLASVKRSAWLKQGLMTQVMELDDVLKKHDSIIAGIALDMRTGRDLDPKATYGLMQKAYRDAITEIDALRSATSQPFDQVWSKLWNSGKWEVLKTAVEAHKKWVEEEWQADVFKDWIVNDTALQQHKIKMPGLAEEAAAIQAAKDALIKFLKEYLSAFPINVGGAAVAAVVTPPLFTGAYDAEKAVKKAYRKAAKKLCKNLKDEFIGKVNEKIPKIITDDVAPGKTNRFRDDLPGKVEGWFRALITNHREKAFEKQFNQDLNELQLKLQTFLDILDEANRNNAKRVAAKIASGQNKNDVETEIKRAQFLTQVFKDTPLPLELQESLQSNKSNFLPKASKWPSACESPLWNKFKGANQKRTDMLMGVLTTLLELTDDYTPHQMMNLYIKS